MIRACAIVAACAAAAGGCKDKPATPTPTPRSTAAPPTTSAPTQPALPEPRPEPAQPAPTATSSQLEVWIDRDGHLGWPHLVEPGGTRPVVRWGGHHVVWAPDGRRLAYGFEREPELRLVDRASGAETEVARTGGGALQPHAWSPDGRYLAAWGLTRPGKLSPAQLVVMAPDSGEQRLLSRPKEDVRDFVWTTDAAAIAYATYPDHDDHSQVVVVSLTRGELARAPVDGPVDGLAWSPRGLLAFQCGDQVCLWDVDTGHLKRSPRYSLRAPVWSPDGSELLVEQRDQRTGGELGPPELWVVDGFDLEGAWRVAEHAEYRDQAWSPDGERIVHLRRDQPASAQIWVVDADGHGAEQLTRDGASTGPAWAPDGARIAFGRDGTIYTMRPDGTDVIAQPTAGDRAGMPSWRPAP